MFQYDLDKTNCNYVDNDANETNYKNANTIEGNTRYRNFYCNWLLLRLQCILLLLLLLFIFIFIFNNLCLQIIIIHK